MPHVLVVLHGENSTRIFFVETLVSLDLHQFLVHY